MDLYLDVFVRLTVRDMRMDMLRDMYIDWLLGRSSNSKRKNRLFRGVDSAWTNDDLCRSTKLIGQKDCSLDVISSDDAWAARFLHGDSPDDASLRCNAIRLSRLPDGGCQLEHAIARHFATSDAHIAPSAIPSILVSLVREHDVQPTRLKLPLTTIATEEDAHRFVELHVWPRRDAPFVVVSCDSDYGPPLVYADRLCQLLTSLAFIVELPTPDSTFAWAKALEPLGLDRAWRCFDGSIRMCGLTADDTVLWNGQRFRDPELTPERATRRVATALARCVSWRSFDPEFFRMFGD